MNRARILIADDHAMIRDGVKNLLGKNKELAVIGEATNAAETLSKYEQTKPDVLILDISMHDMNGMDVAQRILDRDPAAKIIILSMYDDGDYIGRCMEMGIKGYVVKSESGKELDTAVKNILKGGEYFSQHVQNVIFQKYSKNLSSKKQREPDLKLTNREIEIIRLISAGLTSHEMAEKLFISPRTVETHRANLMKKTGVKNSIELIKKMSAMGIL